MDTLIVVLLGCNGLSLVACIWLLRKLCLLSKRLRGRLFAKQLRHLVIVDSFLALVNVFYLFALLADKRHLGIKLAVPAMLCCLCTDIVMGTFIATGFALIFWKCNRLVVCLRKLHGLAWLLGCAAGIAVHYWHPMLSIWMLANLLFAGFAYLSCFCNNFQRPCIMQAVVWRMARVYGVMVSIGGGAWLVGYFYWHEHPPTWFANYSFTILGLQGLLNAITYAYNVRLVAQNVRSIVHPRSHVHVDAAQILASRLAALVDESQQDDSEENSSVFSFNSFLGVHGCPAELGATSPPIASALMSSFCFSDARSRDMEINRASIDEMLGRIDSRWLEELRINTYAEVLNVVLEAASQVEGGADVEKCISSARLKADEVKGWALESVKIRSEARSFVSLCSDCSEIESSVVEWHAQAISATNPLFEQLHAKQLDKVKDVTLEMIRKCQGELESVSTFKENDTNTLFEANSMLLELQQVELAFAENVLQVARANPQSSMLQRSGLQALLKVISVFNMSEEEDEERRFFSVDFFEYSKFVLDAMAAHQDDPIIQRDACIFLHRYGVKKGARVKLICDAGAADLISQAMSKHCSDTAVQENGHLALMAFMQYGEDLDPRVAAIAEQSLQNEIFLQGFPDTNTLDF